MKVNIRADSVEIEGYVNAVERDSKPLMSRMGRFVEKITKGAFKRAIERNNNVQLLLNHERELGSTSKGNLELKEDNIGLHARAKITDKDVIGKARRGELVGWSFGFEDRPDGVMKRIVDGMLHRTVNDLDLYEVSILDKSRKPAYDGTLITVRDDSGAMQFRGEPFIDEVSTCAENEQVEKPEEKREEAAPEQQEDENIDYSKYEAMITEMKGD